MGDEQGGSYYPQALILAKAVDVVRIDLTCMGGITGGRRIVDECLRAGVAFSPHMFAHVHSQVFSGWGFPDVPIEWGVPWTGVDPYADSLAQPTIIERTAGCSRCRAAGLRQSPQPRLGAEPAARGPGPHLRRLMPARESEEPTMSTDDMSVPAGYANRLFDLTGRVAVVTGGGSGLGARDGRRLCAGRREGGHRRRERGGRRGDRSRPSRSKAAAAGP